MPVISTFFGIVIRILYQEHRPPHFHAAYQGQQARSTSVGSCWLATFVQAWRSG